MENNTKEKFKIACSYLKKNSGKFFSSPEISENIMNDNYQNIKNIMENVPRKNENTKPLNKQLAAELTRDFNTNQRTEKIENIIEEYGVIIKKSNKRYFYSSKNGFDYKKYFYSTNNGFDYIINYKDEFFIIENEVANIYKELLNIIDTLNINNEDIDYINNFFGVKKNNIISLSESLEYENHSIQSNFIKGKKYLFYECNNPENYFENIKKWIYVLEELKLINKNEIKFTNKKRKKIMDNSIKSIIGEDKERHNVIIFGAPGTSKTYSIDRALKGSNIDNDFVFRTTFYEDYSYYDFIGQYKPIVLYSEATGKFRRGKEEDLEEMGHPNISYNFISGVFVDSYIKAINSKENVYLIIEEINRGNASAIFGEFFQSLDRKESGISAYPIKISKELSIYLKEKTGNDHNENFEIPSNLKIIATMNTSDQSLFKMDTAFKRRWYMKYSPIETKEVKDVFVKNTNINWAEFITVINSLILKTLNSEDKMIGQYFCHINQNKKTISESEFKDKVFHYLFFDVFRFNRKEIFNTESFNDIFQMNSEYFFELIKSK